LTVKPDLPQLQCQYDKRTGRNRMAASIPNDPVAALKYQVAALTRILNEEDILDYSGHISARLPDNSGYIVQSLDGSRAELSPDDLYVVRFDDEIVEGPEGDGVRPVSERFIHSEIYKARPDVNAVLHAHPDAPVMFTVAKGAELVMVKNHGYRWRNGVPTHMDTAHINTPKLGQELAETLGDCHASLIRAHGIVVVAEDIPHLLIDAVHFDDNAKAVLELTRLGPPMPMTDAELDIFEERFDRPRHAAKLWKYYAGRARKEGLIPADWPVGP
jgi:L-ribulose-5-phosphate 4-epimerase